MTTGMSELNLLSKPILNTIVINSREKINFVLVFYKPISPNESTGFFVIYTVTNIEHLPHKFL